VKALLLAASTAMALSLFGTRYLVRYFSGLGMGQPILGPEDRGPEHQHKAGTPTMGGLAILAASFIGYLVPHVLARVTFSNQAKVLWGGIGALAGLGFLDDVLKVRRGRNRGVFWKSKGYISFVISLVISACLVLVTHVSTTLSFTRHNLPGWELGRPITIVLGALIIFSTTNAVNVTDGLDGLAAGSGLFGFFAFTVMAFWAFRNPSIYVDGGGIVNPLDLAIIAIAFAGASAGFLWWNAAPARIFMGDVGSFGVGSALALLAITTNTQLLLPLICGLNVMEIGSVALQMGDWVGGRGAHMGFSPVVPANSKHVMGQLQRSRKIIAAHDVDFYASFTIGGRFATNINMLMYDRDNAQQVTNIRKLFNALITETAKAGYGEYRTHLGWMDPVNETYDFNHHAQRRLNEKVKDALDPNGILAPGKQGVWPSVYRDKATERGA
jgi:phospho-N-acetylmuramoyl-pentapeptide-transferase